MAFSLSDTQKAALEALYPDADLSTISDLEYQYWADVLTNGGVGGSVSAAAGMVVVESADINVARPDAAAVYFKVPGDPTNAVAGDFAYDTTP
jgi:hypothetical protein